jgi:predicted nuclease with TOPRIM domain
VLRKPGPRRACVTGYRGDMAEDVDIRHHISELVSTERTLREQLATGEISTDEEHERLRRVETELDQCWDLLRQRQALRDSGGDPDHAAARSESTVEGYLG